MSPAPKTPKNFQKSIEKIFSNIYTITVTLKERRKGRPKMIDFHTHKLPNIDNGSRNIEETFNLIKEAKEAGFEGIVLTSHYIEGYYETDTPEREMWVNAITANLRAKGIDIIRTGLQNTDEITDPSVKGSEVVAGPYHPAFRQLVEANLWYDDILKRIKEMNTKVKRVKIIINPKDVNNVVGHKRENIQKLKDVYELDKIIEQDEKMKEGKFKLEILEKYPEFLDEKE